MSSGTISSAAANYSSAQSNDDATNVASTSAPPSNSATNPPPFPDPQDIAAVERWTRRGNGNSFFDSARTAIAFDGGFGGSSSEEGSFSSDDKPEPPPEPPCSGCDCPKSDGYTSNPVRYFNGEIKLSRNDLSSASNVGSLGHKRSYSNQMSHSYDFGNGHNWLVEQWGYLKELANGAIALVRGPGQNLWFERDANDDYQPRHGGHDQLVHYPGAGLYILKTESGEQHAFHDFDQYLYPPGLFAWHRTAGGQFTHVVGYTQDDRIGEIQCSITSDSLNIIESILYQYIDAEPQEGRLEHITLRRKEGSSPWQSIQRTRYEYYAAGEMHGSLGDLKLVIDQLPNGSLWSDHDTQLYRYYKNGEAKGFSHGLKYVLKSESYARLNMLINPLLASDAQLSLYADYYFEYDDQRRVTKETVQAGSMSFFLTYIDRDDESQSYNHWHHKTIETLPDGTMNVVYTNRIGQILLRKFVANDGNGGFENWINASSYDDAARLIRRAQPSAVASYDDSAADLGVVLHEEQGLIHLTQYYSQTSDGGIAGYKQAELIQHGSAGDAIMLQSWAYTTHTNGSHSVYPVAKSTRYRNEDGTGAIETSYNYEYYSGTTQMSRRTTTLPIVPMSQNGTATIDSSTELFDERGRNTLSKDVRGLISYRQFDFVTGAIIQSIQDVDTNQMTNVPNGWTTTSDGGRHLITDYEHDEKGRIVQELGPIHTAEVDGVNQSVRRAMWTVYNEAAHETMSAQGYYDVAADASVLIDPVSITRRNRAGNTTDSIQAVRSSTAGKLQASDMFAQSDYVSWSTTQYSDCCTQISQRVYHTIPSTGEGSIGTHYDETQFGYDSLKRQVRTVSPGGTIHRDVLDVRGQTIASYAGTDDSGATYADPSGGGAAGNDMLLMSEQVFDHGNDSGDGLLTSSIVHVDSNTIRTTSYIYDWRNRQIAIDGELELYQTSVYDNLNRVVQSERRDTTATGQLLSREAMLYDDRGRVYRSIRYGVDPVTGQITTQQDRDQYFDAAGSLLRQEPAGAMEFETYEYDIQGRRIESSDPLGHSRQMAYDAAANQVANTDPTNQVWTQSYDPLGRQVRMVNPLGEATRYSYDAAGRQASVIDGVGNSSHSDYDAAARIFASTDPLGKVTTFTYDANGNQMSVTDANGNTTTSEYDYLDRRIKTTDPAGHNQQMVYNLAGETIVEIDAKGNQTLHGYDAIGRKVSITDRLSHTTMFAFNARGLLASLTDAENQTTAYVYDDYARQVETIWPDHIAGSNPGDIGYGITRQAYDDLNRLVRKTDQLGDTINFVYDVAGRLLARDYRTKANSPNGTIADSDTFSYDAAGRMLIANSGRYSNEVAFTYDAAGRKATESLTVLGHTYVVGTQYDAAGRIAKLIYPDSSEVHRSYTARGELYQISQKVVGGSLTVIDTRVYDDAGRMISSNYSNGVSQVHSYNTDNTLAGIAFSGASIGDLAYTWDVNHNKVSETIDGVMSGYGFTATYDAEDRLITYDRSNGNLDQAWDLTAVGDMNNVTTNTTVQARTHGPAHELLTAGVAPISTDARGNISAIPEALRSNGVKVYLNYDFDNRFNSLTANIPLSQPVALFQNYSYDALGRRVGFQGNNGQTIFVCCGQQVLCDYGVTAGPSTANLVYIYGDYIDEPIMRSIGGGGTRLYYHRNQQYSIIALTDSYGAIQERYAYSAYGELTIANASGTTLTTSAVNNRYTYTGREWDSTIGLYYFRARIYDAAITRFCSRDPIDYLGDISLYRFVRNDPLRLLDPSGLLQISMVNDGPQGCENDNFCAYLALWIGFDDREKSILKPAAGGFLVVTTHLEWRTERCNNAIISEGDIRRRQLLPIIVTGGKVMPQRSHRPNLEEQYFQLANWCANDCAKGCIRVNGIFELFTLRDSNILLPKNTWPKKSPTDAFPYDVKQDEVGLPLPNFPFGGDGKRSPVTRKSVPFQFCFNRCNNARGKGSVVCSMSQPGLGAGPDRDSGHYSEANGPMPDIFNN